ncbi:MAG: VOC family protein [Acidobacteria bacterium]|nr:VOC family protein [Acidobacteriota bacterium]
MRIKLTSIMVDDQDKALRFYTEVLGFRKKHDIPVGEYRWITVTSPEGSDDLELALRQPDSVVPTGVGSIYPTFPLWDAELRPMSTCAPRQILDLFAEDSWRPVYAGELEVRPPGAPTTG